MMPFGYLGAADPAFEECVRLNVESGTSPELAALACREATAPRLRSQYAPIVSTGTDGKMKLMGIAIPSLLGLGLIVGVGYWLWKRARR